MKIVVFIEDFGATGVARNTIAIARYLSAEGHDVTIVATRDHGVLRDNIPAGVEVHALNPGVSAGSRGRLMRRSLLSFRGFLKRLKPDVVFSAGNHGHLLTIAATRLLPCKVIVRISNDLDHQRGARADIAGAWRRLKFRTILSRADRIVLVSSRLAEQVRAIDADFARKTAVIPNGVDVAAVRAGAQTPVEPSGDDRPLVLAVGRLVEQKNFGTLLEAAAIARKSVNFRLLLIGSGPLKDDLLSRVEALGLGESVRIVDPVPNPFPLFKQAAVMVLPSWWEGSSNVLLEALACETPIVASRTAGSAEEVLDGGRYGLLVDPGEADALADAIVRQLGPDGVSPAGRAADYDRTRSLRAYAALMAGMESR